MTAASGFDVSLVVFIAACALIGLTALMVAVLCGTDDETALPEFDDLDDTRSPR